MATCFCGCGSKVKLSRRAVNATGGLVQVQLGAWDGLEDRLVAARLWSGDLDDFVGEGSAMAIGLAAVVHGAPPSRMSGQREMTRWLQRSRRLLKDLDSKLSEVALDAEAAVDEDDDDPLRCPTCGARFEDESACVAHIIGEHGD